MVGLEKAGKVSLEPPPSKQCKGSFGVLAIVNLRCLGLGKMRQMRQYRGASCFILTWKYLLLYLRIH